MSPHAPSGTHQPALALTVEGGGLAALRRTLTRWLIDNGVTELCACDIVLAVAEAATGAAEHADGPVAVTTVIHPARAVVTVSHRGQWRDPDTNLGVLGAQRLTMVEALTEHYDIDHSDDRTTLTAYFPVA
ncbi:ATP-binding protein [Actinokineospora sp. 24-640]